MLFWQIRVTPRNLYLENFYRPAIVHATLALASELAYVRTVYVLAKCDPRKLNREKLQSPTSAKLATLEIFPLYGYALMYILLWVYTRSEKEIAAVSLHDNYK